MSSTDGPGLGHILRLWWRETVARQGRFSAAKQFAVRLCDFARDSLPDRRRQRYGDADYDWEYRVNTTGATVGWRDRLMGQFLSPYQPTEPALFHEMMANLKIDFSAFTFIDLGSGKGRTLLMAANYPFEKIVGVELLPSLHRAAEQNIRQYCSATRRCFSVQSICADARQFEFPLQPTVLYLFNPLPETALAETLGRLDQSLRTHPREVYVIYHNPLLASVFEQQEMLERFAGTHQYVVYRGGRTGRGDTIQ